MAARKTAKPSTAVQLYKVLTADGHSPYITAYAWSLPTQNEDGTWTPGAWHEEPASVFVRGHGLHVTPSPDHYTPHADCITYECEAEGYRENPEVDHHVVALRVRLLRPVPREEAERISREYDAGVYARREKARQKERLDKARESARRVKAGMDAARAEGVESPALTAFRMLVELTPAESWRDVNASRWEALKYATKYLRFDPEDVREIYRQFRGGFWFGAGSGSDERLYAVAVESGNKSACVAWEAYFRRKPWWHRAQDGKRERLYVGAQVRVNGAWHRVTSFRAEYVNAVGEDNKKVVKLTREDLDGSAKRKAVT